MELEACIRTIADFPRPGILFRDITPLLGNPAAFREALDAMTAFARAADAEAIVGIESRGFLFGAPLADRLGLPFVPVRKEGKLPAARLTVEYALEYGESRLDIHQDALRRGASAFVVDDVLATGGTALAAAKLVELLGARVAGMGFLIELDGLGGRDRLAPYRVEAVLRLKEG
ncbi:adenine phosphoribosyltransferase [Tepidiforma sp.]|uniref:adenine phosphoribosyltransferase n=1 Tax=Tepidiforma sp. TaxID=2682230 RepID=UPI002ADD9A95|nr:adenine phosphoribosyltransferase [Tepidiforma sp.]